jgi:NAD(P)-dependent dehydrogenase (short-subunit alcohol dehydrogenase family)
MPLLQHAAANPLGSATAMARPLIVMISSFGGLSYTFNTPYGVAKAAVDRMAKDMAVELGDSMCVTSLWPGLVATER